jgi:TonB family protein
MIKNILCLILCVFLLHNAKAESPDSLVGYFNNSGRKVSKDSADFCRVILPPDTNVNKDYYRVYDYYINGKIKSISNSLTQSFILLLDGMRVDYFPNGKRKRISQFKNGEPTGTVTNYYPNGKRYNVLKVDEWNSVLSFSSSTHYYEFSISAVLDENYGFKMNVEEMHDSTGNVLVEKGNGHAVFFDEQFKTVMMEGNVKNGKKEGEWKGLIADSGSYVCTFHNNKLKTGTSTLRSGHHYNFNKIEETAEFSDGVREFYNYLWKNIRYPESAKKYNRYGTVKVGFYVEEDGTLSNIRIVKGLLKSLDDEALRVVGFSPLWIPAHIYGIPVRTDCVVDVDFHNL